MRSMLRQFGRAPARVIATVAALALAVAAMGVLAIPAVSEGTLHRAAERDRIPDIVLTTTDVTDEQLARVAALDGVEVAGGEITTSLAVGDDEVSVVGVDYDRQELNLVRAEVGRQPELPQEVIAHPSIAGVGDRWAVGETGLEVVGTGGTLWFSDEPSVFVDIDTARELAGVDGANRIVIESTDDSAPALRSLAEEIRAELAADGDVFTSFPVYLPDGTTPIDDDIEQVSMLIGLLGIVAGVVALLLLASTTNTLIAERTREVAVMRALGGRRRPLRRRLRRIATGIALAGLLVGLPLGVVIANVIARMVLEEFVGVTPDLGVSWSVIVGSAVFALVGARLAAARAARRITNLPLAEALRDREGAPFGRRWRERALARVPTGGLLGRVAARSGAHRPARTIAAVTQITVAVAGLVIVTSLTTSVNTFNTETRAHWNWASAASSPDPGLHYPQSLTDGDPRSETAIVALGEIAGWEMNLYGIEEQSSMITPDVSAGEWIDDGGAVVSAGFAERRSIAVGDPVDLDLASGVARYEVVGLLDDNDRSVYLPVDDLAAALGSPGMANVVWSLDSEPAVEVPGVTELVTADEVDAADAEGRRAIVVIFGAIGAIVVGVAALAVASTLAVDLYERRHQLAAIQAVGGRRRHLRRLVLTELVPLGVIGFGLGIVAGWFGTAGIIASFESSNSLDIGPVFATASLPVTAVATLAALVLVALLGVRQAVRRPVAVTLRGAA